MLIAAFIIGVLFGYKVFPHILVQLKDLKKKYWD